jgi:hypothetical protein
VRQFGGDGFADSSEKGRFVTRAGGRRQERMNSFSEYTFRAKVDDALDTVRKILDTTKHPARPADVPHTYDDKYGLVEQATKAAIVAAGNALEVFGVSGAALDGMRNWVKANKV